MNAECLCLCAASVMKFTQGDVSMDGTEHALLADGLTFDESQAEQMRRHKVKHPHIHTKTRCYSLTL